MLRRFQFQQGRGGGGVPEARW